IWQPSSRPATYPWADYEGWQTWAPEEVMSQFDLTFNVDKANELLDALGATERDGDTRILNGQPLRLTMITPAQTTGLEYQIGSSFANTAREAGIDIVYPHQFAANTVDAHPEAGVRALVAMSRRMSTPPQSPIE
ncbi:MAG: hypothetical protein WKF63_09310, partial [Thermomicrobiales bacterium]